MRRIGTAKVLRKRLFINIVAAAPMVATTLAFVILSSGTMALILPMQSSMALNRPARMEQIGPMQKNKVTVATTTTTTRQTLTGIVSARPRPPFASKFLQRPPSALQLGPGNNNSNNFPGNGDGNGGAGNMDPGLKLLVCILIDFIGVASFAAPGVGEATDVGWAPISALLVNYLFGNGVFTALALVEELSPGFDFIPTATIAWFVENGNNQESSPISEAGSAPRSQSGTPPPPPPPRSSSSQAKNRKPAEPNVIDVDIID